MPETEPQVTTVSVDDLLVIIGRKEVQIESLKAQLSQTRQELAATKAEFERLKAHPLLKGAKKGS